MPAPPNFPFPIDLLIRLFTQWSQQLPQAGSAPAGVPNHRTAAANPRPPTYSPRFFFIIGRISRAWGLLGSWTALSYFVAATGHGADVFRSLSNRLAESSFLVRLVNYLFRWFDCKVESVDRVAETVDCIGTFFRHAGVTLKSARDVVNKLSNDFHGSSSAASHENSNHASNIRDVQTSTSDVAQVDSPRADYADTHRTFSSDQRVNTVTDNSGSHGARAGLEEKIISSVMEGEEVISQWKEGNSGFYVDVPLNMPADTAAELKQRFRSMDADCLLQGPNMQSILEKGLESAVYDQEVATKLVEHLRALVLPLPSTGQDMDR